MFHEQVYGIYGRLSIAITTIQQSTVKMVYNALSVLESDGFYESCHVMSNSELMRIKNLMIILM